MIPVTVEILWRLKREWTACALSTQSMALQVKPSGLSFLSQALAFLGSEVLGEGAEEKAETGVKRLRIRKDNQILSALVLLQLNLERLPSEK